jgi:hypothetical protein
MRSDAQSAWCRGLGPNSAPYVWSAYRHQAIVRTMPVTPARSTGAGLQTDIQTNSAGMG